MVKTVAVCQLKKKTVTTQIEKVITRKVAVTRKGIILENQKLNEANPVDSDGNTRCQQNILHQAVLIERLKKQI